MFLFLSMIRKLKLVHQGSLMVTLSCLTRQHLVLNLTMTDSHHAAKIASRKMSTLKEIRKRIALLTLKNLFVATRL